MQQHSYTIAGRPIEVIGDDRKPVARKALVADILALAAALSRISPRTILRQNRFRHVVLVRFAIYFVAREQGYSYEQIGRKLDRDNSTVSHGCRQVAKYTDSDREFAWFVDALRRNVAKALAA